MKNLNFPLTKREAVSVKNCSFATYLATVIYIKVTKEKLTGNLLKFPFIPQGCGI